MANEYCRLPHFENTKKDLLDSLLDVEHSKELLSTTTRVLYQLKTKKKIIFILNTLILSKNIVILKY